QEKKDSDFNVYAQHETYLFLKEQIKSVLPEPQIEEIHRIGTQYEDKRRPQDKQADGTPVSGGWWLTDKEGNRVAYMDGTIKETYPEFRLRNIGDENKKEQTATLRDLDPYSDKSLVEQVVDQLDFPDDFTQHFNALSIWEKDYQEARKDEQRFAYIRYFTQNKGAYIFEDKKDPKVRGNGKEEGKGVYGGYAGMLIDKNGERYSRIVCRSDLLKNNPNKTFFHELYHRVDLHNGLTLSNQDITQFSFMLAQTNNNNLFKNAFQIVDECYPPSEFNKEVLAQIMSYETDEHFKNSDLLKEFYKTGKLFALAKADKVPAMEHRIQHALYDMPELNELNDMYKYFMKDKEEAYKEEEDLKSRYSNEELAQKLNIHRNNVAEKNKEKNQKNEPKRAKLEAALLKRLKKLNQNLNDIYQNKEIIGNIISPPNIINKYQELSDGIHINYEHHLQNLLPKEITQKTLSKQIDKFKYSFIDEQPHSQFLHLYTTIDTLNKLGYSNLPNIPTIDNLPKSFDELMASPEKKEALIDRLNIVSEEIRKGTDQTNLQLACLFNKPSEQLTEDDKLIGYLKRDYAKSSDHKTLAQTFIKKLEENGYNPTEISEKVFGNIDYDNNDNEIIKEISFPKNKIKANRIIDYLDQNYTPETLGIIAITGLEGLEKIPPEKRYRKPCIVAREDGCPIMFRSEYEAQKYIENYNKNKEVKTQVIPPHQQEDSSHKLSDTLKKYSQQTIQNHSVPVEKPNVPKQPMQQNNSSIQKLITPLKNGSR
ncbi:MAG: hypothetical protein IKL32_00585, partial [Alphaproteobacteria bacterium]|nr:hypothetical protein [Alphaproteobacteria bacterium]